MAFRVGFTEEARNDLASAAGWFEEKAGAVLAERFIGMVQSTTHRIAESPEQYAVVYKNYRQCRVPVFEYVITYRVKKDVIEVLAVTHGKRASSAWRSR